MSVPPPPPTRCTTASVLACWRTPSRASTAASLRTARPAQARPCSPQARSPRCVPSSHAEPPPSRQANPILSSATVPTRASCRRFVAHTRRPHASCSDRDSHAARWLQLMLRDARSSPMPLPLGALVWAGWRQRGGWRHASPAEHTGGRAGRGRAAELRCRRCSGVRDRLPPEGRDRGVGHDEAAGDLLDDGDLQ